MLASLRDDKTIPKNTTPKNILKPEASGIVTDG
jgi:hypothetical protein